MLRTFGWALLACLAAGALPSAPVHAADDRGVLEALYARHPNALLWSRSAVPTVQAGALVAVLQSAADYGLSPADYGAAGLAAELAALSARPETTSADWSRFDHELTGAALELVEQLHSGRIDPHAAGFDMPARTEKFDAAAVVEQLAARSDTAVVLGAVEPGYLHYHLLRQSLTRYRALAAAPELPALPPLPRRSVKPGEYYAGAPQLRARLAAVGDLPQQDTSRTDPVLDEDLAAALKRFQYLHGLAEDGVLGASTLSALKVPLAQRVRQIELTLERWRWLPPLRPPTLIVNIPQFRLFLIHSAVDTESDMLRMNVIVGRQYPRLHTPVFTADMTAVLFRPYWDVPSSIVRHELLAELRGDPRYLAAHDMELVATDGSGSAAALGATPENLQALAAGGLRLRQRPGPDNALGLIKFVLPNAYDVYLHSTPAQHLFAEPRRAFSHGCIRVSDPVALAAAVMGGTPGDWMPEKIRAAMDGDLTFQVKLAQPVHVLILYGTAVATEDGALHFFDDIYGQDRRLEALLGLKPVATRP
ncbi:MAG TPA: L,D-transpeptidase family protein [Steroidobacteraceae bacterium]|nr:L,D-transpeptidase family protein [Steroidobacteraceae bacterium]